ncbi:MAG: hypothetical protein EBQ89_10135 [Alphaproteobacteria bacterium]|nr:hypothetical protein [Alphaproteobacteria bacterium]NDG03674.1 hypothetical protein [Synechococcaceae bacterium WBB_34_004]
MMTHHTQRHLPPAIMRPAVAPCRVVKLLLLALVVVLTLCPVQGWAAGQTGEEYSRGYDASRSPELREMMDAARRAEAKRQEQGRTDSGQYAPDRATGMGQRDTDNLVSAVAKSTSMFNPRIAQTMRNNYQPVFQSLFSSIKPFDPASIKGFTFKTDDKDDRYQDTSKYPFTFEPRETK